MQNEDQRNSPEAGMLISNAPVDSCSIPNGSRTLHDNQ